MNTSHMVEVCHMAPLIGVTSTTIRHPSPWANEQLAEIEGANVSKYTDEKQKVKKLNPFILDTFELI